MRSRLISLLIAAVCTAACTATVDYVDTTSGEINTQPGLALERPVVPNWMVTERALGSDSWQISLRAQHFRLGGDGEALHIVKQRALLLQLENGFSGYRILNYAERLESTTPFNFRIVEGVIQLVK